MPLRVPKLKQDKTGSRVLYVTEKYYFHTRPVSQREEKCQDEERGVFQPQSLKKLR